MNSRGNRPLASACGTVDLTPVSQLRRAKTTVRLCSSQSAATSRRGSQGPDERPETAGLHN